MPSFNCDGCGDVIKKPKLDAHSMRCRSSVTCLDCSTTFNTSASWKSHTSCISEAQKYQKSLYKPPKTSNKSNGDIQKNGLLTSTPVTSIAPPSTKPTLNPTHNNTKTTEPTIQSDKILPQNLIQAELKEKHKKKKKKRDRIESTENENSNHRLLTQDTTKTGANIEVRTEEKEPKTAKEASEPLKVNESSSKEKKKKRRKDGLESERKSNEELIKESPMESRPDVKKRKKEKKKSSVEMSKGEDVDVDAPQGPLGSIKIEESAILKHSREAISAANGQPITLNQLIASNLKSILRDNNISTTEQTRQESPLNDQIEDQIGSQIQHIFQHNLGFSAQTSSEKPNQNFIKLSWNGHPF